MTGHSKSCQNNIIKCYKQKYIEKEKDTLMNILGTNYLSMLKLEIPKY